MSGFSHQNLNNDFLRAIPSIIGWKNTESVYTASTLQATKLLTRGGDIENILNKKDTDLLESIAVRTEEFIQQDKLVMSDLKTRNYLEINTFREGKKVHFTTKSPVLDSAGKCIGTCFHMQDLDNLNLYKIASHLLKIRQGKNASFYLQENVDHQHLTPRESEILFYVLYGKSAREISEILRRSKRTVDFFMDNLKEKFNVKNKSQLIDAALAGGHVSVLPKTLLTRDASILLTL